MDQLTVSAKPWWRKWWGIAGLMLGLAVLVFAGYVAVLVWQGAGRGSRGNASAAWGGHFTDSGKGATTGAIDQQRLMRATSPSFGPKDAPLTIVEFADFECPYSGESFPVIRSLLAEYGDRIHFVFRGFPLPTLHEHAVAAAEAAACAAAQGTDKFWAYHDRLFLNQDRLDENSLRIYAVQAGLDSRQFDACVQARAFQSLVEADVADGEALGVRGTPTWFINGRKVEGAIPEDIFRKVIEEILKTVKP